MSKVFGLQGYLTGKLGATVFAVRNGEQIARQYNPSPANPKTAGQIENRAKLKLLSQLGAALQTVIAIPRDGMRSPRNGFTAANYPYTTYGNSIASEDLADIQLTKSAVGLCGFSADRGDGNGINVVLDEDVANMNDAVMYVVLRRTDASKVAVASSLLVSEAGANGNFPAVLPMQAGDIAVCAYGIKYRTAAARVAFANLSAPAAQGVARLYANRVLTASDATLTETRGLYMTSADNQGETAGATRVSINVAVQGAGTVSGAGRYEVGSYANLVATPSDGAQFAGWRLGSASGQVLSTAENYTFLVESAVEIVAVFVGAPVTLSLSADPAAGGTVSGGDTVEAGSSVTAVATANSGYQFTGWYENETLVSSSASYAMTLNNNRSLVAHFEEVHEIGVSLSGVSSVTIDGQAYSNNGVYTGRTGVAVPYSMDVSGFGDAVVQAMVNGSYTSLASASSGSITIPANATRLRFTWTAS